MKSQKVTSQRVPPEAAQAAVRFASNHDLKVTWKKTEDDSHTLFTGKDVRRISDFVDGFFEGKNS